MNTPEQDLKDAASNARGARALSAIAVGMALWQMYPVAVIKKQTAEIARGFEVYGPAATRYQPRYEVTFAVKADERSEPTPMSVQSVTRPEVAYDEGTNTYEIYVTQPDTRAGTTLHLARFESVSEPKVSRLAQ